MKKVFLLFAFFAGALTVVNAQTTESSAGNSLLYKPFKVDFMVGYAMPGGSGAKSGVNVSLEPKYNITNNIAVGFKYELAVMAAGYSLAGGETAPDVDVKGVGSYLVTGEYTLGTSTVRPFAGLGVGLYSFAAANYSDESDNGTTNAYSKFGFAPRIGVQISHFRIAVEYNIVGKYKYDGGGEAKNSYLGLKLGVTFGGGKK